MANPFAPGPLAGGAERLVGALLGGSEVEEASRLATQRSMYQTQSAEASLDRAITEAKLARDKRNAQQEYSRVLQPIVGAQGAEALSSMLIGGHGAQIDDVQKYGMRDRAEAGLVEQGFTPANAILGALQGKPLPTIDIDSGHIVMGQYGSEPVVDQTAETLSKVAENNAQAGAHEARAARTRAMPLTSGGGGGGRSRGGSDVAPAASPMLTDNDVPGAHVRYLWDNFSNPKVRRDFIAKYGQVRYNAAVRGRSQYLGSSSKRVLPAKGR